MTLLTLDACCPKCGTRPNLRITEHLRRLAEQISPDAVLATVGCQHKRCSEKWTITAGMVQRAALTATRPET